jgi:hypothetical protein
MNELHAPDLNPEELANQLDAIVVPEGDILPISGQQDDPRIQIAVRLANAHHPQMSPAMLSRVQAKMIKANQLQLKRKPIWRPKYTLTSRLVAAFTIIMVFFGSTALPALANSVPGEFWYPFKRNLENIEISAAFSATARAGIYLTQAERRLEEAQVLLQRQVFDTNLIFDARNSLISFEQLAPQLDAALPDARSRVALATESVALLIQEAEQQQILSGKEVIALLPTVIPLPSNTVSPSLTPTIEPSATSTSTGSLMTLTLTAVPTLTDVPPSLTLTVENTHAADFGPMMSEEPNLLAVSTATSTPLPTMTATSQSTIAIMYASENANVRNQPSRDQSIISLLQQGTATEVIGEDDSGKWWHVRLSDGRLGWVAKFLLSINKPVESSGNDTSTGNNASTGNNTNGDFGCDHSGNYCNAPGQTMTPPGQSGNIPTPHSPPSNPGGGNNSSNPPSNPGNGHKP